LQGGRQARCASGTANGRQPRPAPRMHQDASGGDRPRLRPTTPTPTFKEMATSFQTQARHPRYRQHRCTRSCHPRGPDDGVASGSRREVKLHAGARRPTDRSAADEGGDCSGQIERIDGLRQERLEPELLHALGFIALAVRGDTSLGLESGARGNGEGRKPPRRDRTVVSARGPPSGSDEREFRVQVREISAGVGIDPGPSSVSARRGTRRFWRGRSDRRASLETLRSQARSAGWPRSAPDAR